MIVVLDTSAAVEVVLQRKFSDKFAQALVDADLVLSPTLLIAETSNVFWKYQKFAELPFSTCEKLIEQTILLPDEYVNERELNIEAFKLACELNHSVYDALFLVLARRNNAQLLTMDKKLMLAADKIGVTHL